MTLFVTMTTKRQTEYIIVSKVALSRGHLSGSLKMSPLWLSQDVTSVALSRCHLCGSLRGHLCGSLKGSPLWLSQGSPLIVPCYQLSFLEEKKIPQFLQCSSTFVGGIRKILQIYDTHSIPHCLATRISGRHDGPSLSLSQRVPKYQQS